MHDTIRASHGVGEPVHVGQHVELDALHGAGERETADEQDEQQHVGEERGEVDHLSGPLDALPDAEVAQHPGDEQSDGQRHAQVTGLVQAVRDLEDVALPVFLDGAPERAGVRADPQVCGGAVEGLVLGAAVARVPPVVARAPRDVRRERRVDVVQRPGQHDDVVRVEPEGHHGCRVAHAFEDGAYFPDAQSADAEELAERGLQEKSGDPRQEQRQQVRNQERSASVLVAEVGKPPDVPQTDGVSHAGHEEVQFAGPLSPAVHVRKLHGVGPIFGVAFQVVQLARGLLFIRHGSRPVRDPARTSRQRPNNGTDDDGKAARE